MDMEGNQPPELESLPLDDVLGGFGAWMVGTAAHVRHTLCAS